MPAVRRIAILIAFTLLAGLLTPHSSGATPRVAVAEMAATARTTPKRYVAMRYALAQRGKPYRYGGTGPGSYDCSGLTYKAYAAAGLPIPRTANEQYHSGKFTRVSKANARWGDLMFWVSGGSAYHVEFVTTNKSLRYGAHHTGTLIGYDGIYGSPVYMHRNGAG